MQFFLKYSFNKHIHDKTASSKCTNLSRFQNYLDVNLTLYMITFCDICYVKGWMNEIYSYDPEAYHATLTHSVYVRLEGSVLRLSKPNRNVPRRATFNEPKPDITYISQKIYDLTNSKVGHQLHRLCR